MILRTLDNFKYIQICILCFSFVKFFVFVFAALALSLASICFPFMDDILFAFSMDDIPKIEHNCFWKIFSFSFFGSILT